MTKTRKPTLDERILIALEGGESVESFPDRYPDGTFTLKGAIRFANSRGIEVEKVQSHFDRKHKLWRCGLRVTGVAIMVFATSPHSERMAKMYAFRRAVNTLCP